MQLDCDTCWSGARALFLGERVERVRNRNHDADDGREDARGLPARAETLLFVGPHIRAGMTTDDINTLVHEHTLEQDAWPSPLNYKGFPKSVCTSVNEVVCHGIPGKRVLRDGDIVNVDVTTYYPKVNGFHGDTARRSSSARRARRRGTWSRSSRRCLELGIAEVKAGNRIGDIGAAIEEYATAQGCSVVRDYVGHGIGREFHMPPQVPHYGKRGTLKRMKAGMIFTIEPMVNLGGYECEVLEDDWTVVTARSLAVGAVRAHRARDRDRLRGADRALVRRCATARTCSGEGRGPSPAR